MIEKRPCVYILANHRNGTLYVGVTRDISRRSFEHRMGAVAGFTHRYNVHLLVFVEFHESMAEAVMREKRIKKWRRAWKLALIERDNPEWRDLYDDLMLCGVLDPRLRVRACAGIENLFDPNNFPAVPAKAGTQRDTLRPSRMQHWMPAFAGKATIGRREAYIS
jgi:putative endonuclease